MSEAMQIARPGETPKARMVKPGTKLGDFVRGAFYVNAKLAAGWEIIPDPANRLLQEWVKEPTPFDPIIRQAAENIAAGREPFAGVPIDPPKKKGRPAGSKNKRK